MSLSKIINRADKRKCISLRRNINFNTNAEQTTSNTTTGLSTQPLPLTSHWKRIEKLKERLSEIEPNEIMRIIRREYAELVKKVPKQLPKALLSTDASDDSSTGLSVADTVLAWRQGLRARFIDNKPNSPTTSVVPLQDVRKWRKKTVSAESIRSRTSYLIASVQTAHNNESLVKRLDDLSDHLLEYPDAAGIAVKQGALRTLLRIRERTSLEQSLRDKAHGLLSLVGHVDPPAGRGIRILSIDGGGVRGLLVIEMLRRLEQLTGQKTHKMFDYICGVSTGSIIAATIGVSAKPLEEIAQLYKELSTKIFTQNAFEGARSLLWNHGYYDTSMWEKMLQDNIGPKTLYDTAQKRSCPKVGAVSTVIHQGQMVPFVFRNYEHAYRVRSQYIGSNKHKLWEAARASAAAPAYFGEFRLGNYLHQDGGMLVNNPTAVALHEAKLLWPRHAIQCVVSCGTGRLRPTVGLHHDPQLDLDRQASWKEKVAQVLVSATDTEGVHTILSDLLPSTRYFRFNPYLTEMLSMVEYQPEKLALLEQDAAMYIRRNDEQFAEAADMLAAPKPLLDKCREYAGLQAAIYQPF